MTLPVGLAQAMLPELTAKRAAGPLDNALTKPLVEFGQKHLPQTTASVVGAVNSAANQAVDNSVAGRVSDFAKANPWVYGAGAGALGGAALGGLYGLSSRRKNKWRAVGDAVAGGLAGGLGGGLLHHGLDTAVGGVKDEAQSQAAAPSLTGETPLRPRSSFLSDMFKPIGQLSAGRGGPATVPAEPAAAVAGPAALAGLTAAPAAPAEPSDRLTSPAALGTAGAAARRYVGRPLADKLFGGKLDPAVTGQVVADAKLTSGNAADKLTGLRAEQAAAAANRAAIGGEMGVAGTTVPEAQTGLTQAQTRLTDAQTAQAAAKRELGKNVGPGNPDGLARLAEVDRAVASAKNDLAMWNDELRKAQALAAANDPQAQARMATAEREAAHAAKRLRTLQATRPTLGNKAPRYLLGGPASGLGMLGEAGVFTGLLTAAGRRGAPQLPATPATAGEAPPLPFGN
jgi:hypothetical protein